MVKLFTRSFWWHVKARKKLQAYWFLLIVITLVLSSTFPFSFSFLSFPFFFFSNLLLLNNFMFKCPLPASTSWAKCEQRKLLCIYLYENKWMNEWKQCQSILPNYRIHVHGWKISLLSMVYTNILIDCSRILTSSRDSNIKLEGGCPISAHFFIVLIFCILWSFHPHNSILFCNMFTPYIFFISGWCIFCF